MFKSLVLYFKKSWCKYRGHKIVLTEWKEDDGKFIIYKQHNDCSRCGYKGMSNVIKQRKV